MLRIFKYLKPYAPLILVAIALLFVQANADLSLPDYMSDIVNYGIQQGGVPNAVPAAIRASQMDRLTTLMSNAERQVVLADYTLVDSGSTSYAQALKAYPALADAPVYILNSITAEETARLNPIIGRAFLEVGLLEQIQADPSKSAVMGPMMASEFAKFPPGADVFAVIGQLPASVRSQISERIKAQFGSLGATVVTQMAVKSVKAEYTALRMDTTALQSGYISRTGLLMLLMTLLSISCTIGVSYLSARTASGLARDLRRNVFQRVESFSSTEFDKFSTASLITRSTNDVTQIQVWVMMVMRMVIYAPIIGVGGVFRALAKSASMWWIIALAVVVLLGLILAVFSIALPKFKIIQSLIDRLNLVTRESLSGMMVIRAFNMQAFEEQRFDAANKDVTSVSLFVNRVMVVMMPLMMLIMNGVTVLIIWVGAHAVAESTMQVGDMIAFMQYAMQIVFSFLMMSMMFIILPRAAVSAERIADVLDTEPYIKDPVQPANFPPLFKGTVEFRNVNFRYPGAEEDVLHDISFTARPGETTAFVGTTGSGKSTIVNLIPRFYEVSGGAVLLDGMDIRSLTQHDLREKIGYVPQKSSLFSGTIESNLRYASEEAPQADLELAAQIAQASDFINAREEGLASEVAQGGTNVSGGQRQRLSIARALVKKAPIYIFDDSFSALDYKTDSLLRKALKTHAGASTMLVVTQRIATIMGAEQIIVLDEGHVVGKGRHEDLMKSCEVYRDIALSQLSKEELS